MDDLRRANHSSRGESDSGKISSQPKALVIHTAFLGDILLSLPAWMAFAEDFEWTFIVRRGLGDLISLFLPHCRVFEIDKKNARSYEKVYKSLANEYWDWLFVPHQSFRTAWWARRIRARQRVGYLNFWSFMGLYSGVPRNRLLPEPLRILQLLVETPIGKQRYTLDFFKRWEWILNRPDSPNGHLPPVSEVLPFRPGRAILDSQPGERERQVAFFAGSRWGAKRWPLEYFMQLDRALEARGVRVLWLGDKEEGRLWEHVIPSVRNLAGQLNWERLWNVLKRCAVVVSGDSGGGHLAALAGCRVISLWGPTDLSFGYRPWGDEIYVLFRNDLPCRPCHHHGPPECPLGHHECMYTLNWKNVLTLIESKLNG